MRTIAIVNQKGGCGKTTVSINVASALADAGKRVLLVDMDAQSHCAVGLAVPEQQIEQSIYDVLISRSRNEPIKLTEILWQINDRLELAPASIDLSAYEQQMAGVPERELCLKEALHEVRADYDFAIVDCPPAVGLLTFSALRAATDVIVPVETGYFALHGLSKQLDTLSILCKRCSQHVDVRVVASMYDIRTKMAREILAELRTHFGDRMFKTVVNFNTKIKEASSFGQPVGEYDPTSKGRKDFSALAEEILGSHEKQQRRDFVNSLAGQLESISVTADELLRATKPAAKAHQPPRIEEIKPAPKPQPPAEIQEPVPAALDADEPVEAGQPEHTAATSEQTPEPRETTSEEQPPAPDIQVADIAEEPTPGEETAPLEEPHQVEATDEYNPAETAAKLSDYYGVSQMMDAVVFVTLYPRAQNVQIAGDFNNWQPGATPMEKLGDTGVWQTKINLPQGRYRYRLVVDGQWQQDPYNEHTELNPFGDFNSVIEIK
jgi:chromosome partitioning protein